MPRGRSDTTVHQVVVPGQVGGGSALGHARGLPRRLDGKARCATNPTCATGPVPRGSTLLVVLRPARSARTWCIAHAGPVHLDLPKDVMTAVLRGASLPLPASPPPLPIDAATILRVAELMKIAKKPILYVGQGANDVRTARETTYQHGLHTDLHSWRCHPRARTHTLLVAVLSRRRPVSDERSAPPARLRRLRKRLWPSPKRPTSR